MLKNCKCKNLLIAEAEINGIFTLKNRRVGICAIYRAPLWG